MTIRKGKTSNTELSTLADCEMKWWLRYGEDHVGTDSPALLKGRAVHVGLEALHRYQDVNMAVQRLQEFVAETNGGTWSDVNLDALDGPLGDAWWLVDRYASYYPWDEFEVRYQELDLSHPLPGTTVEYQAIIDEVWKDERGELWVVEHKTYGDRRRLANVEVDPQLSGNLWVARKNGIDAVGVIFNGVYTYRWKQERPLSESFDRFYLDRSDEQLAAAALELRSRYHRRWDLDVRRNERLPMRNLGPACSTCDFKGICHERLAFDPTVILLEDGTRA